MKRAIALSHGIPVEVHIGSQIDLVHDDRVHSREDARVLVGLVVSFGNAGNDDTDLFAQLKFDRADEIPDVFNKENIDVLERGVSSGLFERSGHPDDILLPY